METTPLRWGIIGTGNIASQFARGLASLPDATLAAVGSRSQSSADAFGDQFAVPRRHSSYEALANDPGIDVVYVSTPHALHYQNTMMCLESGKAVLCEKPFALNAAQTAAMITLARKQRLFLMEAVWTRFLPVMQRLRALLAEDAIGEPRMVHADFGFRTNYDPNSRLFDPALGGGALLDVGIYPVSLASMVFGTPDTVLATATLAPTGVDEQCGLVLQYPGGQLAVLSAASRTQTPHNAMINGTRGTIHLQPSWWMSRQITITRPGQDNEVIDLEQQGNGYNYEAAEVARCIRAGMLESPIMPLDETLSIMQTLDTARAQWGLRYPGE